MHGHGIYTWSNGDVYDGEWKDNLMDGEGSLRLADGTIYKGTFAKGKKEGAGVMMAPNGHRLVGFYKNDLMDGPFEETDAQGTVLAKASYLNGVLQTGSFVNLQAGDTQGVQTAEGLLIGTFSAEHVAADEAAKVKEQQQQKRASTRKRVTRRRRRR